MTITLTCGMTFYKYSVFSFTLLSRLTLLICIRSFAKARGKREREKLHVCLIISFPTNVSVWKRLKDAEDGPPFLCPKCGRTYSHKCNLTRHLRLECGVGPRFQCGNCKKRFKHRHHLRDHQRIHLYANCYESRN